MSLWVQSLRIFTMQIRLCLKALFVFLGGGNDRKGIVLRGQVKKLRETLRKVDCYEFILLGPYDNLYSSLLGERGLYKEVWKDVRR